MRKHIRNALQALGLALVLASTTAHAGVWVGGGIEYYNLGEYLDYYNGTNNVTVDLGQESGFRPFVEASTDIPLTERTRVAVSGRAYGGNVDFSSRGVSPPVNSTVDYRGLRVEGGLTFTPLPHGDSSDVSFLAMAGYETWTRKLAATNEEEDWTMPFVRLGAQLQPNEGSPWTAKAGFLIPFNVTDRYKPTSSNYHPEPSTSFFLGIGRRFTRFVEAGLNYEALRFSHLDGGQKVYATPRVELDSYQLYVKVGI